MGWKIFRLAAWVVAGFTFYFSVLFMLDGEWLYGLAYLLATALWMFNIRNLTSIIDSKKRIAEANVRYEKAMADIDASNKKIQEIMEKKKTKYPW